MPGASDPAPGTWNPEPGSRGSERGIRGPEPEPPATSIRARNPITVNIEHLKTFLDVARTGSFHRTAKRLHVSQSTVSARIRTLEEQTGQVLFHRLKNGAVLTGPGRRIAPHADTAVRAWERGRQYLALADSQRVECALGIQSVLAEWLATEWLGWVHQRHPEIALRTEAGDSETLMRWLDDALLDIAVAFLPRTRPGFRIETLFTDNLILVSSDERSLDSGWRDDYVFVDWGESFRAAYADAFPDNGMPSIRTPLPGVALNHILLQGGAAYLTQSIAEPWIAEGRLHEVRGAPFFPIPAFVVYPAEPVDEEMQSIALQGLAHVVRDHRR